MNAIAETPTTETPIAESTPRKLGRPDVLDERRRANVLYFIGLGLSRRMAARQVRCAHTTIARTAARDPLFALDLANAENEVDVESMRRIREAAKEQKNWRAAAWLLERRNPDEFGRRTAHSMSGDHVMELLADVFSYIFPRLPEEEADGFLRMFNAKLQEVEDELQEADRWRRLAAEDRGVRGRGRMEDLRSPYEHPDWYEPPAVDPAEEERPEDDAAYAPLPTIRRVMPEKLAPEGLVAEESFNADGAPGAPACGSWVAATAPEMAVGDLQAANSQNTVAGGSRLNEPAPANRLLHHNRLSCQAGAAQDGEAKSLTVNNLRQHLSFAPPPRNGEAVQKSNGKPPEKEES